MHVYRFLALVERTIGEGGERTIEGEGEMTIEGGSEMTNGGKDGGVKQQFGAFIATKTM